MFANKEIFETVLKSISGISVDSREIKPGDLFIAIKGEKVDGHKYAKKALNNGAVLVVVEHEISDIDFSKQIVVNSSIEFLTELAKYNISKSKAKFIAVTGSVGKTTTRQMIHYLIEKYNKNTYATHGNFNSKIGLPICSAMMPRNTEFGVFEMGMGAFGDIKHLISIVPPSISVITKICECHLEFFNSIWDIAKAKSEIFEIKQDYTIIPGDSIYTDFLKEKAKEYVKNVIIVAGNNSDAYILNVKYDQGIYYVTAMIFGEKIEYSVKIPNIEDTLSAIIASHVATGISLKELAESISEFEKMSDRGGVCHLKNYTVINDTYNACPTSLKAGIKSMARNSGRKILVVGDMLELGKDAIHMHENISATIDKYGIDKVFACGTLSKYLFDNLQKNKCGAWTNDSKSIIDFLVDEIKEGDTILVKGSHSMRMDIVVDNLINREK